MSLNLKHVPDDEGFDQDQPPGAGHNSGVTPPGTGESWDQILAPEGLNLFLQMEYESLSTKSNTFLKNFEKWKTDTEDGIKSAELAASSTDVGRQIKDTAKLIESTRVIVKAPFKTAVETVDAFFAKIYKPLTDAVTKIETSINAYNAAQAAADRKRLAEEAAQKRKDADALAAAAIASNSMDLLDEAQAVDAGARQAEKIAAAPLADHTRVRGSYATSSASVRYKYEVADISLVPREWLIIDDSKVNRSINGKDRIKEIPGLTIIEETKTTIR
jgi:hypothetical protein